MDPAASWSGYAADPYVDYGRFLTPEGGILILYKDIDQRLRHWIWRAFAWLTASGGEGWFMLHASPVHSAWLNAGCWIATAVVNWLIVAKPVEIYRRIEIRPDCLIIDGADIFWLRLMEAGWPEFQPDEDENQVLRGIYGSRLVEYLTIRRFDEFDRAPEVFAAHLRTAIKQLWEIPDEKAR